MTQNADQEYWIAWESRVIESLVDLADYGFVCDRITKRLEWCDEERCLIRPGLAEQLQKAREALPSGYNFKIIDGWRSRTQQLYCHRNSRKRIHAARPELTQAQLDAELDVICPPPITIPKFNAHRYGGAIDLTMLDEHGEPVDMGGWGGDQPDAALLYYEWNDDSDAAKHRRDNRRLLIRAMQSARFDAYLPEWWHWGYDADILDLCNA